MPSQELGDTAPGKKCPWGHLILLHSSPLCSGHTGSLPSSDKPSSYLSQGLCSRSYTCLAYLPQPSRGWFLLIIQDSAQMSLPQRPLKTACKVGPIPVTSFILHCIIFFRALISIWNYLSFAFLH